MTAHDANPEEDIVTERNLSQPGDPPAHTFRPGPAELEPGQAPGGYVVAVYTLGGGLVVCQRLAPGGPLEELAEAAAEILPVGADVILVVWDGDDGHRLDRAELGWVLDRAGWPG